MVTKSMYPPRKPSYSHARVGTRTRMMYNIYLQKKGGCLVVLWSSLSMEWEKRKEKKGLRKLHFRTIGRAMSLLSTYVFSCFRTSIKTFVRCGFPHCGMLLHLPLIPTRATTTWLCVPRRLIISRKEKRGGTKVEKKSSHNKYHIKLLHPLDVNTTYNKFICIASALFTSTAGLLSLSMELCGKWPGGWGESEERRPRCVYFSLLALAHFFLCKVSLSCLRLSCVCCSPVLFAPYSLCLVLSSNQSAFVYLSAERRVHYFVQPVATVKRERGPVRFWWWFKIPHTSSLLCVLFVFCCGIADWWREGKAREENDLFMVLGAFGVCLCTSANNESSNKSKTR